MKLKPKTTADYFGGIEDPRIDRRKQHKLIDIITIAIYAVVCGTETWVDLEVYGKAKFSWLNEFLELAHGIPSHDTFTTGRETRPVEYSRQLVQKNFKNIS